jgi:hypothetical protein
VNAGSPYLQPWDDVKVKTVTHKNATTAHANSGKRQNLVPAKERLLKDVLGV